MSQSTTVLEEEMLTAQSLLDGLAAAAVPKPTVAQYTRYFSYLQVAKLTKESGSYGQASRHEMMVMLDHFPEKSGSRGARRGRKSLKRHNLSSAAFPKRGLLERVRFFSRSFSMALLP
jgi:hypothetical protein